MSKRPGSKPAQVAPVVVDSAAPAAPAAETHKGSMVVVEGKAQLHLPGLGNMAAAQNVLARAASLRSDLPADLAGAVFVAGKPCKVRVPYTLACWERVAATLASGGGSATAGSLAAVSTTDFVRYAFRRGWLVKQATAAAE